MTDEKQRSIASSSPRLAAYRKRAALMASAQGRVHVRQALAVGPLGVQLDLDTVPGVVWAEVWDQGRTLMPPAQVHLEVWGGDLAEVAATVERVKPVGVLVTIRRHHPNAWRRLMRWGRFTAWRVVSWLEGVRGG